MTIENKDSKQEVDPTTIQANPTEEKKDNPPVDDTTKKTDGDDEQVTLSKKELEAIQKKAQDFDGIIEKRRLEKLNKKETVIPTEKKEGEPKENAETLTREEAEKIAEEKAQQAVQEALRKERLGEYSKNLESAYKKFVETNKWADQDSVHAAISEKFNAGGAISEEELLVKLNKAAEDAYPAEYEKAREDKIRAKVLAEANTINAGNGGGGASEPKNFINIQITDEDRKIAERFFAGDVQRYLKYKKNN